MEGFTYVDIFATKGIEYLVAIAFLILLVYFWRWLNQTSPHIVTKSVNNSGRVSLADWFKLDDNLYYHQGHSWARPEKDGLIRIGIDDFAQKLLGRPDKLSLPAVGTRLKQGENGILFQIDGKNVEILSPIDGEVVAVNDKALETPAEINKSPYENGWLLKLKSDNSQANLKNLLKGNLARAWMEETVDKLSMIISREQGVVLQDGGIITNGFVKELAPDNWDELASEFLMTERLP